MFLKRRTEDRRLIEDADYLPSGLVVETEKGFYYIKNDVRLLIPNDRVLASWRFVNIPLFTEAALRRYPVKGKLPYRDGSLIKYQGDAGKEYYVSGGKLRLITDIEWYDKLGLNVNDVIIINKHDFDYHSKGEDLT